MHRQKLFAEITHRTRNSPTRISVALSRYSTLCYRNPNHDDPVDPYADKDHVISWTSVLSKLVRQGQPEEAIGLFKTMLMSNQRPNYVTILSLVKAFDTLDWEALRMMVHGLVIKMGFESEPSVLTALIGSYSVYGMGICWSLFNQIPNKDVVLRSAMVSACVKNGDYVEALELFRRMQFLGLKANHVSIVSILPACANLGALQLGREIHGFIIRRMICYVNTVQNSLVDMYAKCRSLQTAIRVFNGMLKKDLVSWRTLIRGYVENECGIKALDAFSKMQRLSFFALDEFVVRDMIMAVLQSGESKIGSAFHCYILKTGFLAFVSIATALLQMYAKFSMVASARNVFDHISNKDVIAWNAMISAYAQTGLPFNAINTFRQMLLMNEKPSEFSLVSLLQICSLMASQEVSDKVGETIHAFVAKVGYSRNVYLSSALIDFYCRFGRVKQGKALFDEVPTKDLICWSSMINGYVLNGYGIEALETFANMLDCGIKPNDIIFLSVLSACSHCGLKNEGWNWFYSMKEKYGITPKLAHYACMVDLLSRQGHIEQALHFVKKMPMEPDKRIWGALLAGCRVSLGPIKIVEFVVERLSTLDPQNSTHYYMILSDLYAEEGRGEDAKRLRRLRGKEKLDTTVVNATTLLYVLSIDFITRTPAYYVILQCGTQEYRSKVSPGKHEKVLWNEKFKFEFPQSEWENLTHITFRIMDKEFFTDNGFVGKTIIHLGGIIAEGTDREFIELRPAPYNVVLEDDTYKGQIKIGFKFIAHKEMQEFALLPNEPRRSFCSSIRNLWKFPWWKFLFLYVQRKSKNEHKDN
ncbi:C2 domain - like 8 [Theobroma cacao]|nr:C2 domain - like 8 [Theobroma cacao]